MTDTVHLHDRCLAMQLSKEPPPPLIRVRSHPSPLPPIPPGHQSPSKSVPPPYQQQNGVRVGCVNLSRRLNAKTLVNHLVNPSEDASRSETDSRNGKQDSRNWKQDSKSDTTDEQHCSTESGSPTPTNAYPPILPKCSSLKHAHHGTLNGYQDGFLLFQSWVSANLACVWDEELVKAVRSVHFVGLLVGGFVLVGGTARVLAAICHAHSRALLCAPPGWIIVLLGDLQDCSVNLVIRGQFTPLGDALCWVIHYLTSLGQIAEQEAIRKALLSNFTSMVPPEPALMHAAISDLIRQRKVFHSINGYGIVKRETYSPAPTTSPVIQPQSAPRLLSTSEALTKAHGDAVTVTEGNITHTSVQTDLVDMLRGPRPESMIVVGKSEATVNSSFQRTGSLEADKRMGLAFVQTSETKTSISKYEAEDYSDITVTGADRTSVFSKLLRVSNSRKRLATFSAQFPPPTWSESKSCLKHCHSVATQTRSAKYSTSPESCWLGDTYFIYRSSTLPRRPSRSVVNTSAVHNLRSQSASPSHVKLSENKYNRSTNRPPSSVSSSPKHDSKGRPPAQPHRMPETAAMYSKPHPPYRQSALQFGKLEQDEKEKQYVPKECDERYPSGYIRRRHAQNAFHSTLPRNIGRNPVHIESYYSKSDVNLEKIERDPKSGSDVGHTIRNVAGFRKRTIEYAAKRLTLQKHPEPPSRSNVPSEDSFIIKEKEVKRDRADMHLELTSVSMNNSKKIMNSPQSAEIFKSNGFLENFPSTAKISATDLTFKNLGYTDVDKSEKKMYIKEPDELKEEKLSDSVSSMKSMPLNENVTNKDINKSDLDLSALKNKINESIKESIDANQDNDEKSVKNYPSLSNLHFSSLTAQKILQGVSMNSIDTLVEVNLVAEKQKSNEIVTNTDFGFV